MIGNVGRCVSMLSVQLLLSRDQEMHHLLVSLALYQSLKISFSRYQAIKILKLTVQVKNASGRNFYMDVLPFAIAKIVLFVIMNPPPET